MLFEIKDDIARCGQCGYYDGESVSLFLEAKRPDKADATPCDALYSIFSFRSLIYFRISIHACESSPMPLESPDVLTHLLTRHFVPMISIH